MDFERALRNSKPLKLLVGLVAPNSQLVHPDLPSSRRFGNRCALFSATPHELEADTGFSSSKDLRTPTTLAASPPRAKLGRAALDHLSYRLPRRC